MHIIDKVIHDHLTRELELLVKADVKVKYDHTKPPTQIDFLALDAAAKTIYFIKVADDTRLRRRKDLNGKLNPNARVSIESAVLRSMHLNNLEFPVKWLLFVRRANKKLTEDLPNIRDMISEGTCEVRTLEDILETR